MRQVQWYMCGLRYQVFLREKCPLRHKMLNLQRQWKYHVLNSWLVTWACWLSKTGTNWENPVKTHHDRETFWIVFITQPSRKLHIVGVKNIFSSYLKEITKYKYIFADCNSLSILQSSSFSRLIRYGMKKLSIYHVLKKVI